MSRLRRHDQEDDQRFRTQFHEMHAKGAEEFRLLWFLANRAAVDAFRSNGLGDELERRGRTAAALTRAIYQTLLHARHAYKPKED